MSHSAKHTLHAHQGHLGWNNQFPPQLTIAPGDTSATIRLSMPTELRNRVTRIDIEGEESAGAKSQTRARAKAKRKAPAGKKKVGAR